MPSRTETNRLTSGYRALRFRPLAMLSAQGRERRFVLTWLFLVLIAVPSSLFTRWMEWTGIPIELAGNTVHLTVYLPLLICIPMVLWFGYLWGAIPAYFSTFVVALAGGMPLEWVIVFSFANPLGLIMYAVVYRVTGLRTDLRNLPSFVGFCVVALLSSLTGSSGSFVWAFTNEVGLNAAYPVWQGWWLGGWLQSIVIVAPVLFLFGPAVKQWMTPLTQHKVELDNWRRQLLFAFMGSLTVLIAYLAVARMFSFAEFELVIQNVSDDQVRSGITNVIDSLSYPLFVLAAVMVAAGYFAYRAVLHWSRELINANRELAEQNLKLEELASTDPLTKVANRRRVMEQLENDFARSARDDLALCVIMVDADHFKRINDDIGHIAGDAVLQELAADLQRHLRDYDHLGRYGGEEFILVLPGTGLETGRSIAERLRSSIEALEIDTPLGSVNVTVSIGIAAYTWEDETVQTLIDRADQALLKAKETGRNKVCVGA